MESNSQDLEVSNINPGEKHCGIIMPIGSMDGYPAEHWFEVQSIIMEAAKQVDGINFKTNIVSRSDGEIDIIHKRIIQNLYNADIVICDISGKNPNVMFELGMRLTFDKPTVIIKDDATDFIFDTGIIEHLIYPKDLRFQKIVDFKKQLARRIKVTYDKSQSDSTYSTFLRNFGEFKVPKLDQTAISDVEQLILEELHNVKKEMVGMKREISVKEGIIPYNWSQSQSKSLNRAKKVIREFIVENRDLRNVSEIMEDEAFIEHLVMHNIPVLDMDTNTFLKVVYEAQKGLR
ncbi:RNA helicase [Bacillus thuringiensis]|uniref:RNA helicase n=1 Tax=Bacillus thuringiensis TaxID=1428 RepID=A0A9X7AMP9_BACTU|nr:RNA helicase [Bacillus thuringiensis]PFT45021.1 RNA helicase [Bacillus thuringiensis]